MPFRKRCKIFNWICSFNDGFWTAIKHDSKFFRVFGAGIRISHAKKWPMLLDKCLAGSVFSVGLLCSLQRFSTFLSVFPIYSSPHEHLPLYITQYIMIYPCISHCIFYCSSKTIIEWANSVEYFTLFSKRHNMWHPFNDFNGFLLHFYWFYSNTCILLCK